MGNRACTGVLCYDIDPERSVQEEATNDIAVIYSKNLPWRFKRALSNSHQADDSIVVSTEQQTTAPTTRGRRETKPKTVVILLTERIQIVEGKNADKQQQTKSYSDISAGTNDNAANSSATNPMSTGPLFSPYHHCRTMSSETCGREARNRSQLISTIQHNDL